MQKGKGASDHHLLGRRHALVNRLRCLHKLDSHQKRLSLRADRSELTTRYTVGTKYATSLQAYKPTRLQGYKAALPHKPYKATRLQGDKATRLQSSEHNQLSYD